MNLKEIQDDRLCRILLDKDKCLPNIPEATDKDIPQLSEMRWQHEYEEGKFDISIVVDIIDLVRIILLILILRYYNKQECIKIIVIRHT